MINISKETHYNLYRNYLDCYEYLKNINQSDYDYPEEKVNFHVYSELKTEKELECIKSYFATQNLQKTNLILWSDYSIENLECLAPFKDQIIFKIYDPIEEAKGTVLEGQLDRLLAKDNLHYLQSDLLRILALHKYGGIWIDMDVILLKDFKPLLDQEYMYQWGSAVDYEIEGACATVLSLKKNSEFSQYLIKEIPNMPIRGGSTIWGKDMFARVYQKYKYTILPGSFFNIEWLISIIDEPLSQQRDALWFEIDCPDKYMFLDCFAWHWHNSANKNKKVMPNSKFDKLIQLNNKKLIERGFLI